MNRSDPSVLVLTWEYPPIVEGGLARHVGKLSRRLAAAGIDVHVLTRGGRAVRGRGDCATASASIERRRRLAGRSRAVLRLGRRMNAGLLARPGGPSPIASTSTSIHGHDWLVADAAGASPTSSLGRS